MKYQFICGELYSIRAALSCPHAAEISSPLLFLTMAVMFRSKRMVKKALIRSREGLLKGAFACSLNGIRFTFARMGASRRASSWAWASLSLTPLIRIYSKVILFLGFISNFLQAASSASMGQVRLTGIRLERRSLSVALSDTARLTSVSSPS